MQRTYTDCIFLGYGIPEEKSNAYSKSYHNTIDSKKEIGAYCIFCDTFCFDETKSVREVYTHDWTERSVCSELISLKKCDASLKLRVFIYVCIQVFDHCRKKYVSNEQNNRSVLLKKIYTISHRTSFFKNDWQHSLKIHLSPV